MQRWLLTITWICASASAPAFAQVPTDTVREFVRSHVQPIDSASRVDIVVGHVDAESRLATCERSEPFLNPGARLWGHSFVGLRCIAGADWSIHVPVDVRVFAGALRAAHPLAAGTPIKRDDVRAEQVEVSREPRALASAWSRIEGKVPTRAIATGQLIGLAQLREPPVVAQGDPVKVLGSGQGFSITTEAIALANAAAGEPVRIRTDSGKILTGTARAGRVVELVF
jgi:flagellar basal body P-ring formation protein FlgA